MPDESRRAVLRRASAVAALAGASGCTTLTAVEATVTFTNGNRHDEVADYQIRRGGESVESGTVRLAPGEERVVRHPMRTGDSVLVTKEENRLSFRLERAVCPSPRLDVDVGAGIGGSWDC